MTGGANGGKSVFTIAPGAPFVDALAAGIQRLTDGPESLADVTVLLPTRRACRSLREAFLRLSQGRPLLLPRMIPLGDIDAEELELAQWGEEGPTGGLEVAPALGGLRRQLLLTRLVLAFEGHDATPEQAAGLATELARLVDQVRTERLDFVHLKDLVPAELANHWEKVLQFLTVLTETWPDVLTEEGCVDPAERRNQLLRAQADLWRTVPPSGPVIAAGTTGTIPATADLLDVVAGLDHGCVVLPGLDRDMDDAGWDALEPTHPQYGMKKLLVRFGLERSAVADFGTGQSGDSASSRARARLIAEALRSAPTTHLWAGSQKPPPEALEGLEYLDCPTPREEAAAIALMMREALEEPGRRAALITPDRRLARRVAAELARWGLEVDDSAGQALAESAPGTFLHLAADCLGTGAAPVPLLALLKHPLASGGEETAGFRARVRRLDAKVLRGPRPAAGFEGLARAIDAAEKEKNEDLSDLKPWLKRLGETARPFARLLAEPKVGVRDLLAAHVAFVEAMAAGPDGPGAARLWLGDAGEAAAAFVAELAEAVGDFPPVRGRDYPGLFRSLMAGRVVRPHFGRHPRLAIWGLLEARLQQADLLILGGLNEGTWPPEVKAGPWMSRPMQKAFGLPLPERRIGLSAHDFAQAAAAPRVVMTRSARVDGTPTLPSRWLMRLENLLRGHGLRLASAERYLHWAETLDAPRQQIRIEAPRPTPPVEARPKGLSVTRIETWIRDPYALYAEKILDLRPLDPLDADPGAADRGSMIHEALERFVRQYPRDLPEDAVERLIDIGRDVFGPTLAWPGVRAFWWPRFKRIARWFVDQERRRRREGYRTMAVETWGEYPLPVSGRTFVLSAKADRIDRTPDGGLAIVDYKTGVPPSWPQVTSGLAPQLSLEGAMAAAGRFQGLKAGSVSDLVYLRLSGGRIAGEEKRLGGETPEVCTMALEGLRRRVAVFWNPDTPYLSRPRPMFVGRFADYDHLARVLEWSAGGEDAE